MEPIKQEIINNIFENGDKLITGPILQTVLIDMIDDVNGKDQEILSKTGSWDDAVTQIPNLATKEEVTNLSESVARDIANVDVDLTGYATETWVQSQGYLTEHQDISGLATKTELNDTKNILQSDMVTLSGSMAKSIEDSAIAIGTEIQNKNYASKTYVDNAVSSSAVDLTGYATEQWVQSQGYLKEHQDISGLATKTELTSVSESVQTDITNLSESVANSAVWKKGTGQNSIVQILSGDNEAKTSTATGTGAVAIGFETTASGQASHAEGLGAFASEQASHAEGLYTTASGDWSHAEGSNTVASSYGSHAEGTETTASGQASHAEGRSTKASGNFSHAEGAWTRASGDYSHAEGYFPVASGEFSHAEGYDTEASGQYSHAEGHRAVALGYLSHAEGSGSNASGTGSHAEGYDTNASGQYSHAEGYSTIASNAYEHAQGQYNYTSSNQIFSVGAGEKTSNYVTTRRNAISVLAIPNSDTETLTSSFFVQNIGGYDGTNPLPGTNDLATVINDLSSGGGSSETLWEKGTGTDSIVQAIASGTNPPTAPGKRAIAEGQSTHASGDNSHAEGYLTNASGNQSHAEGFYTVASNAYEHAQGIYNHSSKNQIFSIGTGNSNTDRRNAVSVLEVSNSGSYTSSLFVQNVGGYDGTNPTPGTNDLATVINGMSTGGSSETLWKKGEGQDSIAQVIADGTNLPTASGERAIATGLDTKASGNYSHAEGGYTTTSNQYEHAQGQYNYTSSNQIFSVGAGENANGTETRRNAVSILAVPNSETQINTASFFVQNIGGYDGTNPTPGTNDLATVIGGVSSIWKKGEGTDAIVQILTGNNETNTSTATGTGSIATGIGSKASGSYSHAEGQYANASGDYSHAEGYHTLTSYKYGHAEGEDTKALGRASHAEGYYTSASGEASHAEGYYTSASGRYSHAEGNYTKASEYCSHAEGVYTTASNHYSHAEGDHATASGAASHAEGNRSIASGNYSHAEGIKTTASGTGSHAEGCLTSATNQYEHAQGICNSTSTNQIFSVGAGEISNPEYPDFMSARTRRNAISVLAVPNADTNILTASFFVQNIGGYDGTNPTPGTNDLATVINGMSTGGGTATSTETWTFTLDDGSTVTKNIVMK